MIRKIGLLNFMAHAQTELYLADGLTVLVGPNNIGKSTIALALKILARNANSNFVMQHNRKECTVSVETSEGHSIQWVKRKSPSYVINGQTKDRLGRGGTPPELDGTLRLAPVEFEDKDFEPHFGDQKSPIFLINRSPSQIAQFFSTTSDAERLVAMQRLHQRNRSEAQTQSKLLTEQNSSIQLTLEVLEGVPQLEAELAILEVENGALDLLERNIGELQKLVHHIAVGLFEQHLENHRLICLNDLEPVPMMHPTDFMTSVVEQWSVCTMNFASLSEVRSVIEHLFTVPVLDDVVPLQKIVEEMKFVTKDVIYWKSITQIQADLPSSPIYAPTESLRSDIRRMDDLFAEQRRFAEIQDAGIALMEMQREVNMNPLKETIVRFLELHVQLANTSAILDEAQASIEHLDAIAAAWLQTDPICNQCGVKLTAESIRYASHPHG